jgi:hypothetical protein
MQQDLRLKTIALGLHDFGMRTLAFSLIALLAILDLAELQAAEPQVRPALIGNGPNALINLIDTKKLMAKGQGEGLLMFTCHVNLNGKVQFYYIYRETPGSKLLKEDVGDALSACRFIPAIYNGHRTEVSVTGTVVFLVKDGKPHLRIYMNQNHDDIAKGNDFIAPQLLTNTIEWEAARSDPAVVKASLYRTQGAIQLSMTVDANGNQRDLKVILEDPPGLGFGDAERRIYAKARWIPGFRNGHPVECTFDYAEWFVFGAPARPWIPR